MAPNDSNQCAHFIQAAGPRDKSNQNSTANDPPSDVDTLDDDNDSFGKVCQLRSPSMEEFLKDNENGHYDKPARMHTRIQANEPENIMTLLTGEVLESPTRSASAVDSFMGKDVHSASHSYLLGCPSFSANLNSMFKIDSFKIASTAADKYKDKDNVASTLCSTKEPSFKIDIKQNARGVQNALPSLPVFQNVWSVNAFMQLPVPMPILISGTTKVLSKRKRDSEEFSPVLAAATRHFQTNGPTLDIGCRCSRTRCLKLYCDCFRGGKICTSSCSCTSCLNTKGESGEHGERTKAIHTILSRRPDAFRKKDKPSTMGCACRNSKCLKKYCVCFSEKTLCGSRCVCTDCLNVTAPQGVTGSGLNESVEDTASLPLISQLEDERTAMSII
ncbi:hypothetical protein HJC23_001282 [Cyclotella cryptica]|uniref:CRC domain-containing protein n=1 Tax=Cyclotella cryptica TaxID=29204 RepID=A0ABD3NT58_9STRA|eukprot:CCRYP_020184-RA/>CCRYP_020184-RA protein AED:0.36 eAED:-0.91 QI:0/-1/0/1/-1/1/1/0/387